MKKTITIAFLCMAVLSLKIPSMEAELKEFNVMLDWFVNPDHGSLIVAQEKGFFKERGLKVNFIAPSNPNDPPKLVAAGKVDLAVSYQPQHHLHVDQGLPVVRVATLIATPLNALVTLADGPILSIADLKGKTIGYSIGGFETVLLKVMLAEQGLSLDDVTLVNVNFSLSPSLFAGQTHAVIGAFRNFELNQMEINAKPGRAFYVEEHGIPSYDELILIAHRDRIQDADLRLFVEAIEAGVQSLINHPEESWRLFIRGRENLDDELNRRAWKDTLTRFSLRPGALDHNRYLRFAHFLKDQGMIKSIPSLEDWAVELKKQSK
jgi:putative hydroxymethylpyrimidine transport system substrate-binding protein